MPASPVRRLPLVLVLLAVAASVPAAPAGKTLELVLDASGSIKVLDSETGAKIAEVSSIKSSVAVLPGLYDVTFGGATWPNVKLEGGVLTTLRPGRLTVEGASFNGHKVFDTEGREIGEVSSLGNTIPLPPGSYAVVIGGKKVPLTLGEGEKVTLSAR